MKNPGFSLLPKWRSLIPVAGLASGKVQVRAIMGRLVAAVRIGDSIYVFDGRCPHAGVSLHGEEVKQDGIIECPKHSMRLSLDALPCSYHARLVRHVPFRVNDGMVEVNRDDLVRALS